MVRVLLLLLGIFLITSSLKVYSQEGFGNSSISNRFFNGKKRKLLLLSDKSLTKWQRYKTCVENSNSYKDLEKCKYIILMNLIDRKRKSFKVEKKAFRNFQKKFNKMEKL